MQNITDPDLYALVLQLAPAAGGPLPDAPGHQVQALFFELVRQVNPELANDLHADAAGKPFTVATLPRNRRDTLLEVRVALLATPLWQPVVQALLQQIARPALRLGSTPLLLRDVPGTPGSHPWAGFDSYAALVAAVEPAPRLTLEFVTPTAISQGTDARGRKKLELLPLPGAVFGALLRRWNLLAPPAFYLNADMVAAAWAETLISEYQIQTRTEYMKSGPQKGFVGHCTYELPPDPAQQEGLTLLADAAFYLGVGAKTTRGMGLCRRVGQATRRAVR
ncbi:MAG: CRISPR system precrRNA processing endoribonuclease RAMP protein Cas6 [Chloroflexaceae bacterium]|nr:CRISPR system precrRNA processing endoribonuclease RAMP protein Cas6 [Chloroflexaceae bacterium]NJO07400.1 CRISPR system precrRNA processing endoribonuclease RAMP protein Cas6 [Chloroflexaceae bacterium]